MRTEFIDTLIIGGGQAGLAMSHMLSQRGCPNIVVERHRIAERWRTERWEGLRFQFPNWSIQLPDFPFAHSDPNAFATSDEIVKYLTAYATFIRTSVRCGVNVQSLRRRDSSIGFVAETSEGRIEATNVVVATGPYQRPIIPTLLSNNSTVFQMHANHYRRPGQLPSGAVLVIGSGASGVQIAEELLRAGRQVYLSVGRHRRMPRRYRGRDLIWWLSALKLDQTPVEKRGPDRSLPLITGAYGGHTLDFRQLAAQGVRLLGHLRAAHDDWLNFAPDLAASLAHGDAAYAGFLDLVDAHVERNRLNVPQEPSARANSPDPGDLIEPLQALNLRAAGIGSVIWATGYGFDLSWIDVPVLDARGQPLHRHGITNVPGMYFIGLQWLSRMISSFLSGVGDDARQLADHIAGRRNRVAA
ncbi:MAG TPA: NAD(P)/FAD-dependent oxidoreductase [Pseudolabrys sp.]|nr:NAD(P)/FAD-dependent oxidoreductase [Pseudolabrys sp.]